VFAIAMTLLVASIDVPVRGPDPLALSHVADRCRSGRAAAVILYALASLCASRLETVLFTVQRRVDALRTVVSPAQNRKWVVASLIPVAVFAASIPIALASPTVAMRPWLAVYPLELLANRMEGDNF
jgi:hypothetical protein